MADDVYGCGKAIANANTPGKKGTICCRLYNAEQNKYYLLTANHVMHAGYSYDDGGWLEKPLPTIPKGNWVWGRRTQDIDIALIEIDAAARFVYPHADIALKSPRVLTTADQMAVTVTMVGQERWGLPWLIIGQIINHYSKQPHQVGYTDGEQPINGLIAIAQATMVNGKMVYHTLSSAGDSGALVYDDDHRPIGMAIAGDEQFTYVLPFGVILKNTGCVIA